MTRNDLKSQSGAIMLEVIAVLSLMGLMGTMLYRQIYLRNQELHNIQMASEIRVIKEAYSAYIQANAVLLHSRCGTASTSAGFNAVARCEPTHACESPTCLYDGVANFVPDGYFFDSASGGASTYIQSNYDLSLWCYDRGDAGHQLRTCYGIIVPKPNVLPDGGSGDTWNFRRAARVAMLIGIDGGAFDPNITVEGGNQHVIAGAVGTWSLPIEDVIVECGGGANCSTGNNLKDCDGDFCPTYVALTGLDIFQPEIEMPQGEVNLDHEFSLVLDSAHVYNSFSAGGANQTGAGGRNCYTIAHDTFRTDGSGNKIVNSDEIPRLAQCRPAFYVEGGPVNGAGDATGNVRVLNDLTVGQEYDNAGHATEAAMRFDKNGMIVFEKAVVADPQTQTMVNYVVDPQFTSVMNDIKIMSRGGARLSDILPNYILKDQQNVTCSLTPAAFSNRVCAKVTFPTCPRAYNRALVVLPFLVERRATDPADPTGTYPSNMLHWNAHKHTVNVKDNVGSSNVETSEDSPIANPFSVTVSNGTGADDGRWIITGSYTSAPQSNENVPLFVQTYCVFDNTFKWGAADGSDWNAVGSAPNKARLLPADSYAQIKVETVCRQFRGTWNSASTPQCTAPNCGDFNEETCKEVGGTWSGGCSGCPSLSPL